MDAVAQFLDTNLITLHGQPFTLGQILLIPLVLVVGYALLRWFVSAVTATMGRNQVNPDIIQIVRRALIILGLVILFITALDLLNVPLTAFAFISGAVAIGFGFGAQNIINNFISGWILMWERPIRINDVIEIGDTVGTVEQINTRSTRIRRVDGVHLLVPNSQLLEEAVINWTLVDRLLRCIVRVGVAYGSPVKRVAELIERAASEHPEVLADPAPQVIFEDFGDNALVFDVYFWVQSTGDRSAREIRSDIRFRIEELFATENIVIAFPQRDVHVDGELLVRAAERGA